MGTLFLSALQTFQTHAVLWYASLCSDKNDYRLVIMREKAEVEKTNEVLLTASLTARHFHVQKKSTVFILLREMVGAVTAQLVQ